MPLHYVQEPEGMPNHCQNPRLLQVPATSIISVCMICGMGPQTAKPEIHIEDGAVTITCINLPHTSLL